MSVTTANKSILSAKYSKGDKIQSFWNKDYISALFGSGKAAVAAWMVLMQGAVYCPCFYNETLERKNWIFSYQSLFLSVIDAVPV